MRKLTEQEVIDALNEYALATENCDTHVSHIFFPKIAKKIVSLQSSDSKKDEVEQAFEDARLLYKKLAGNMAKARGFETEFADFKRKHKDYKEAALVLCAAIRKEDEVRKACAAKKEFFPVWKNFKTWLNQRTWETEYEEMAKGNKSVLFQAY